MTNESRTEPTGGEHDKLAERLAAYRADVDAAIGADRESGRTAAPGRGDRPTRRALAIGVGAMVVVVAITGLVAIGRRGAPTGPAVGPQTTAAAGSNTTPIAESDAPRTTTGPTPVATGSVTSAPPDDLSGLPDLLTVFGDEVALPRVPDGWKTIEIDDLRFAVPDTWPVLVAHEPLCGEGQIDGIVTVHRAGGQVGGSCGGSAVATLPDARLVIEPSTGPASDGGPATIGTLLAYRVGGGCGDCPPTYRLDGGVQVTALGPDADTVLATFTDSSARRALQRGPVADTTGWQTVRSAGIAIDVPAAWGSIDLPGSFTTGTNDAGNSYVSGRADPGQCGGGIFAADTQPSVYLGSSPFVPSCPAVFSRHVPGGDGLWVRPAGTRDGGSIPVMHGALGGLDVTIVRESYRLDPALTLLVRRGAVTAYVTIGVGANDSVARAILRSLRPA